MNLLVGVALALALPLQATPTAFFAAPAIVADAQRFTAEWDRPGAHADVQVVSSLKPGQPATVFVLFRDCRPAADGTCHVKADLQVFAPDGKLTPLAGTFVVWSKAAPPAGMFYRSEQAPTIRFDNSDPAGRYVVRTTITDVGDGRAPLVERREGGLVLEAP